MWKNSGSWTEAANVVWVDQPAGVGFSSRPGADGLVRNESEVGDRMLVFLQGFYGRFPKFLDVPFFIFGESYAGHYVPAIAARVLRRGGDGVHIPLTGVGIGNGLVSPLAQFLSKPQMARTGGMGGSLGEGVVSEAIYSQMMASMPACADNIRKCQASKADRQACIYAYTNCTLSEMLPVLQSGRNPYDLRKRCSSHGLPLCYDESLETAFMNDPRIQEAFGLHHSMPWAVCNLTVTLQFVFSGDYFRDLRPQVVDLLAAGIRVLVYSGDDDYMVDWLGSKTWMTGLQWPHRAEWTAAEDVGFVVDGRTSGMVKTSHGLTFLQIYNAGHLVPMDQPAVALSMVRTFLSKDSPWSAHGEQAVSLPSAPLGAAGTRLSMAALAIFAALASASFWVASRALRGQRLTEDKPYLLMA